MAGGSEWNYPTVIDWEWIHEVSASRARALARSPRGTRRAGEMGEDMPDIDWGENGQSYYTRARVCWGSVQRFSCLDFP